jgi:hypothetical protein
MPSEGKLVPLPKAYGPLVPLDQVRRWLAEMTDVGLVADFARAVEAARGYDAKTQERRDYWSELAIWSTRRLAALVKEGQKNGTIATATSGRPKKHGMMPCLSLAEVYHMEPEKAQDRARRDRAVLGVPDETVPVYISQQKEAGLEFSKAGLLRFVKEQNMEEERLRKEELRRQAAALGRRARVNEILTGDFREALDDLPDGCARLVLTDPPYDDNSVPIYGDLAVVAERLLCDGGSLITYAGHHALPAIFQAVGDRLRYWWELVLRHRGPHAKLVGKNINVGWKPLLWFVKGGRWNREYLFDVLPSNVPGKELHDWEQGAREAEYLIEKLTGPGDLVIDPMCGSGTVPAAALRLGRKTLGVEIDPDRADVARKGIQDARATRVS